MAHGGNWIVQLSCHFYLFPLFYSSSLLSLSIVTARTHTDTRILPISVFSVKSSNFSNHNLLTKWRIMQLAHDIHDIDFIKLSLFCYITFGIHTYPLCVLKFSFSFVPLSHIPTVLMQCGDLLDFFFIFLLKSNLFLYIYENFTQVKLPLQCCLRYCNQGANEFYLPYTNASREMLQFAEYVGCLFRMKDKRAPK